MFHSIFIDVATSFYGCAFFVKWSEAKCFLFGTQWRFLLGPGEIVARFATTEALASQRSVLKEPRNFGEAKLRISELEGVGIVE